MIGEFEYLILAAVARLRKNAYGASIAEEIKTAAGRRCSLGALSTTLDRLEAKGMVTTYMGDPTAERGGRAKRMVEITGAGRRAAGEFFVAVSALTRGIDWVSAHD